MIQVSHIATSATDWKQCHYSFILVFPLADYLHFPGRANRRSSLWTVRTITPANPAHPTNKVNQIK